MILKKIKIMNYRQLQSVELDMQDSLTVLAGPNNSGKTTLISVLKGMFCDKKLGFSYKQDNISDTTKYEDHFVAENRLIAISKSGRSMDSEDVQNFLKATERGIDVQLFVRKNKDDKISKEFYYLGRVIATGNAKQFVMPNTDKTAVEIEWELETPVREDIYQYIVNE